MTYYYCWGCRGNLTLITLGSGRVKSNPSGRDASLVTGRIRHFSLLAIPTVIHKCSSKLYWWLGGIPDSLYLWLGDGSCGSRGSREETRQSPRKFRIQTLDTFPRAGLTFIRIFAEIFEPENQVLISNLVLQADALTKQFGDLQGDRRELKLAAAHIEDALKGRLVNRCTVLPPPPSSSFPLPLFPPLSLKGMLGNRCAVLPLSPSSPRPSPFPSWEPTLNIFVFFRLSGGTMAKRDRTSNRSWLEGEWNISCSFLFI